jgi:hypothetical protein
MNYRLTTGYLVIYARNGLCAVSGHVAAILSPKLHRPVSMLLRNIRWYCPDGIGELQAMQTCDDALRNIS